jgi:hypothetical protein
LKKLSRWWRADIALAQFRIRTRSKLNRTSLPRQVTPMFARSASFRPSLLLPLALVLGFTQSPAQAHDYPTADRVVFVQACMRDHPGPHYEMLNKCACTLDTIARDLPYDDFVDMSTATNANSIGGERGNSIRDVESMQVLIRKFRQIQTAAMKSCMINLEAR